MAGRKLSESSRQNHHGESWELVKLEAELRKAYTLKILQAQVAEKDANREIEEIREKFAEKMMINEIQDEIGETMKKSKEEKSRKCKQYRNELEGQMQSKEEEKKRTEEEERRERRVMVEVDRIRDEKEESKKLESKIFSERITRANQIQEEMKEIFKRKEAESSKEEDMKNRKYLDLFEKRKLAVTELRADQTRKREEVVNLMAGMIIDLESRKKEKEALIADLVAGEIQCEVMIRERDEYLRRRKEKEDLVAVLEDQISFNEVCKIRFVEQDRDFAEAVMKRIIEDERFERSTLEARRRRMINYREELERLMAEKRALREEQIAKIQEDLEAEQLQEENMRNRLRDERISLLELHSESVADFIDRSKLNEEEQKIIAGYRKRNK